MPTLVLHGRHLPFFDPGLATTLAARIPQSRLVLLDGGVMPDAVQGMQAIDAFLEDLAAQDKPLPRPAQAALPGGLSMRESEVLRLLAAGKSNQQIADELVISRNTVRRHVSNLFDKTGVANRAQAVAYARDHGIQ
jgi:DNA-binding NarL/FixJ family response regulator